MTTSDYFNTPINEDYFSITPEWDTPIDGGWVDDYFSTRGNTHWDTKTSKPSELISLKRQYSLDYYYKRVTRTSQKSKYK